jgi:hypothetical protein
VTSLVSGVYSFFIHPPKLLVNKDGTVQWENRMQAVRERLPATVREIGYVSDSENVGSMVQEFVLTQYALIPVVVRRGTEYEWIVGNFTQPGFEALLAGEIPGDYTIEKLGAGIYLIHRSPS